MADMSTANGKTVVQMLRVSRDSLCHVLHRLPHFGNEGAVVERGTLVKSRLFVQLVISVLHATCLLNDHSQARNTLLLEDSNLKPLLPATDPYAIITFEQPYNFHIGTSKLMSQCIVY